MTAMIFHLLTTFLHLFTANTAIRVNHGMAVDNLPSSSAADNLFKTQIIRFDEQSEPTPSPIDPSSGSATGVPSNKDFCIPKDNAKEAQLQANLDYACGQGIDCKQIQPGGACYDPNTVSSHAAFAMNSYFRIKGQSSPSGCDFSGTGQITSVDPSYKDCHYL